MYDSLLDDDPASGDDFDVRRLRFESPALCIDVEVHDDGDCLLLETSVEPPTAIDIDLRYGSQRLEARSDARGHCALGPVCHGLVSLLVETVQPAASAKLQTAWVRV